MLRPHTLLLSDPEVLDFICDTLRIASSGWISPFTLDALLDIDLDLRRLEAQGPVRSLDELADALPGFGIVAAILGVILAMGSMGESPARIGVRIASALIGTFTGILMAYGIVAPVAVRLEKIDDADAEYFETLRAGLASFAR